MTDEFTRFSETDRYRSDRCEVRASGFAVNVQRLGKNVWRIRVSTEVVVAYDVDHRAITADEVVITTEVVADDRTNAMFQGARMASGIVLDRLYSRYLKEAGS